MVEVVERMVEGMVEVAGVGGYNIIHYIII